MARLRYRTLPRLDHANEGHVTVTTVTTAPRADLSKAAGPHFGLCPQPPDETRTTNHEQRLYPFATNLTYC